MKTQIFTDMDYNRPGKHVDWLYLPHSVTRSAYGTIPVPVACISNGEGPTVLLMAGNHGDEYEGQIVLNRFIRAIDPSEVSGRIIVLPALNAPAALAGTRVSPVDGHNLNRSFPGDPDGSPTSQIAHYVDSVVYPIVDYCLDTHSGGSSLEYLPFVSMRTSGKPELDRKAYAAMKSFGMPIAQIWNYTPDTRLAAPAAAAHDIVMLSGEFGGGGRVSIEGVSQVWRGLHNFLTHIEVLGKHHAKPATECAVYRVTGRDDYVYAPDGGLFEPFHELGTWIEEGAPCGQVVFVDDPLREPVVCHFRAAGMLICKRSPGRVERGDCVAHLAVPFEGEGTHPFA